LASGRKEGKKRGTKGRRVGGGDREEKLKKKTKSSAEKKATKGEKSPPHEEIKLDGESYERKTNQGNDKRQNGGKKKREGGGGEDSRGKRRKHPFLDGPKEKYLNNKELGR